MFSSIKFRSRNIMDRLRPLRNRRIVPNDDICGDRPIHFGDASRGFACCRKTLNCFDDLPEQLDDTVFHHANIHFSEAQRLHLCHDIDEAFSCYGDILSRPNCKGVQQIMEDKLKPQMDKVKLFYFNTCNRATSLSPSPGGPSPSSFPSNNSTSNVKPGDRNGNRAFKSHSHMSDYAPFIGGAIMGIFALVVIVLFAVYCRKRSKIKKRNKEQRTDQGHDGQQSSRYKTVSYNRRKSETYAEIDEKSMITSVSFCLDGQSCSNDGSCGSRTLPSSPSKTKIGEDNNGYLTPRASLPEDTIKLDVTDSEANLFTHGYIELKSESGDSAQSYAKLQPEPEEDYIKPDQIASPTKVSNKADDKSHMYFVLEKENSDSGGHMKDLKDLNY